MVQKRDAQIQAELKEPVSLSIPSPLRDDLDPENIKDITKTVVTMINYEDYDDKDEFGSYSRHLVTT